MLIESVIDQYLFSIYYVSGFQLGTIPNETNMTLFLKALLLLVNCLRLCLRL